MTKAEEILEKHLKINDVETMLGKHGRTHNAVINALNEAINYTHCCTELCDCAIPDPIDPFAEVDKDTCRKCNNLIA